jgi:hypothetical protein
VLASKLAKPNLSWDKVQLAVFFAQETFLSLLYIRETRLHLKRIAPLHDNAITHRRVFHHLIMINILIICLDISLIGLCYSSLFYVQGHYKPCVYGIKLRMEFTILNDLRTTLQYSRRSSSYSRGNQGRRQPAPSPSESNIELTQGSRGQNTPAPAVPIKKTLTGQGTEISLRAAPRAAWPR